MVWSRNAGAQMRDAGKLEYDCLKNVGKSHCVCKCPWWCPGSSSGGGELGLHAFLVEQSGTNSFAAAGAAWQRLSCTRLLYGTFRACALLCSPSDWWLAVLQLLPQVAE